MLKINTKEIPLPKVIHMFFHVQEMFNEDIMTFIFQHIINEEGLVMNEDGQALQFKFRMINQTKRELLTMYNANEYY